MDYQKKAQLMVERLNQMGISDPKVLQAMRQVPRDRFISSAFEHQAYDEKALPIGFGQTISHPYTVARMTEILGVKQGMKILEIGTGSGYQAAVLAQLGAAVFSVEINKDLYKKTKHLLNELGYKVAIKVGDGRLGWQTYAPYAAIIVTAGAAEIPNALLMQLDEGGRLLIPVGQVSKHQLMICQREQNAIQTSINEEFSFVPLISHQNGYKQKKI